MAVNRAVTKTRRITIRLPEHLERRVARMQKKLHHPSASKTFRHLVEKGLETYTPRKAGKSEKTESERGPV